MRIKSQCLKNYILNRKNRTLIGLFQKLPSQTKPIKRLDTTMQNIISGNRVRQSTQRAFRDIYFIVSYITECSGTAETGICTVPGGPVRNI